ncbi:tRNA-Thr(GGU) m(6)t(6)A37 methyltransferase TsaA [Ensifer adhaerens]|nr:tRNA-Thr(GGU) m(6)t(6)A37 methyltransferase TsaA [Ensifer adhaerens]
MVRENEIRENEVAVASPSAQDAGLEFIGRISTPWTSRMETPRQGRHDGPVCVIEIFEPWDRALEGVAKFERLEILYWLDRSRRDLVLQSPASNGKVHGTFSLRTPVRPNPIGTSIVVLERIEGNRLFVRGGLPRRHTASRPETRSYAIQAHCAATAGRLSDGPDGLGALLPEGLKACPALFSSWPYSTLLLSASTSPTVEESSPSVPLAP